MGTANGSGAEGVSSSRPSVQPEIEVTVWDGEEEQTVSRKRQRKPVAKPSRRSSSRPSESTSFQQHEKIASLKGLWNKKLKGRLRTQQKLNDEATRRLRTTELMLFEEEGGLLTEGLEKTYAIPQADIVKETDLGTREKILALDLPFGPYAVDFSRNGRHLLLGGKKGSLSLLDCHTCQPLCEINVKETVRDVKILHNHTMWAAVDAAKKEVSEEHRLPVRRIGRLNLRADKDFRDERYCLTESVLGLQSDGSQGTGDQPLARWRGASSGRDRSNPKVPRGNRPTCVYPPGHGAPPCVNVPAAQKKYLYIYDQQGIELHCLRDHMMTYRMDFLPYHYLLVSVGEFGELIKRSRPHAPPHTWACFAVVAERGGQRRGVSSPGGLWQPAVELLCHKGRVTSLDVYRDYMVTSGVDGAWKIWDLRTYKPLHAFQYFGSPPSSARWSQTGMLALGFGSHVQFWKDAWSTPKPRSPYLTHEYDGKQVESLAFRPFEDLCIVGLTSGVDTVVVPQSGIANFDTFEANPYETSAQRREREIHSLLEKLQPDMITVDKSNRVGAIDSAPRAVLAEEKQRELSEKAEMKKTKKKTKQRGRNTAAKVQKKAALQYNQKVRALTAKRLEQAKADQKANKNARNAEEGFSALDSGMRLSATVSDAAPACHEDALLRCYGARWSFAASSAGTSHAGWASGKSVEGS
ncbi:putative WD domain, G-beta repeat-containing protein [Neospora caninum Liverpool]|uniref:Putative WD domain, G-beta repeat-containing protein n=1 Tax=Neospora caninum (strain Liverpool) TaxID=572307 RepID=F0VJS8_NEOCL|nr:putative WD domain, G-beta repeat-containing protein [Neospora caninum Liverpool]CBZ53989.1 putative WD domain, G-beta repeat-containing protein [Neospora caninum Liverpool]|eukprot:XP_003884021.1 putative WD domain, G-beta repeat-containing protein [Neospora caninum Liverpool]